MAKEQMIQALKIILQETLSDPEMLAEFARNGFDISINSETAEKAKEIINDDAVLKFFLHPEDIEAAQNRVDDIKQFFDDEYIYTE